MIGININDGLNKSSAKVTERGQLVVAPLGFSKFYLATASVDNVAVNVVPPLTGKCFVITAIILGANRDVGVNGAIVNLFEAASPTSATIVTSVFQDEIAKSTTRTMTSLNIIVSQGTWLNVKTDDNIVRANVAGYYISA